MNDHSYSCILWSNHETDACCLKQQQISMMYKQPLRENILLLIDVKILKVRYMTSVYFSLASFANNLY